MMLVIMMNVYMKLMLQILIMSTSISLCIGHKSQIHKRMTDEDIIKTFRVYSHDQVPNYDVVVIRSIQKREMNNEDSKVLHMSAFGEKIKLNLKKNDNINSHMKYVKMFSAQTSKEGHVALNEERDSEEEMNDGIGHLYQDEDKMAAVMLKHDIYGDLEMEGIIGENLVVRPVPKSVRDHHSLGNLESEEDETDDEEILQKDKRVNVNEKLYRAARDVSPVVMNTTGGSVHIVYRTKSSDIHEHSDYMLIDDEIEKQLSSQINSIHGRQKRASMRTAYPEILIIVDYQSYLKHGRNDGVIKRYIGIFLNAVDLRYRTFSTPEIRISLAGIIISKDSYANPYLEKHRLGGNVVDVLPALTDFGKYLYGKKQLPAHDAAVLLTPLDVCGRNSANKECKTGTAGVAKCGGACVVDKVGKEAHNVAIIEDHGAFNGIKTGAHEIAHLLGSVHDGEPALWYLGGPGATQCPFNDGYIMSYLRESEKTFRWSSCSIQQFKHFLRLNRASCLFNKPVQSQNLIKDLPGKILSLDDQCKKRYGSASYACVKDIRVCINLYCFKQSRGGCVAYHPAAEGSPCGNRQYCRNGKCISDTSNMMYDYYQEDNQRSDYNGRRRNADSIKIRRNVGSSSHEKISKTDYDI